MALVSIYATAELGEITEIQIVKEGDVVVLDSNDFKELKAVVSGNREQAFSDISKGETMPKVSYFWNK